MEKFDQRQRLLLVIALSFGFITLLQVVFGEKPDPNAVATAGADAGVVVAAATSDGGAEVAAAPAVVDADGGVAAVMAAGGTPAEVAKVLPMRELDRVRRQMNLRFSTEGGSLTSAVLTGPREREQQQVSIAEGFQKLFGKKLPPPEQMNMAVPSDGQPNPLSVGIVGGVPFGPNTRYEVVEETDQAIAFRASNAAWQVDKRYTWEPDGFALNLAVTVKNLSSAATSGTLSVVLPRRIDPKSEEKSSLFGGIGNEAKVHCLVGDDLGTHAPSEDPIEDAKGAVKLAAIDQQYFLAAVYPKGESIDGACSVLTSPTVRVASVSTPIALQAGESKTIELAAFMGPKDFELLKATGHGLEKTVDFGWWAVICKVLLAVLQFFFRLVGNWGLAIILLTVSVKVLLLPLTHKAMVSAEAMKKLQPKMEEIKKKFPDDRERQNVEVMKLYQEAKVNPLGGCLPLLLQLPIWAALFTTLRTSYDLYGEPFYGPVWTDLTYKDPTYLLPFALGITMIITQRLQPQMMDKQQAFIFTWIMPVFFTALMMNYPAGLSLYIFTNNLLSILQQFLLRKYLEKKGIAAPRSKGGGSPPGPGDKRLKESAS
ncbi:MAG: membrane protein insertase YidC [Myxococcaceae bacterium]|nr:membrane protein insertase YidC [Myxococcaceae bacterium]